MSEKVNLIDQATYTNLKAQDKDEDKDAATKIILRSSKFKNKHRKPEQQASLLDFVVKPRPKTQRQIKARKLQRPHLPIINSSYMVGKPKGKTRIDPKKKITKLKRSVRSYRTLKKAEREVAQQEPEEEIQPEAIPVEQQVLALSIAEIPTPKVSPQGEEIHSIHSRRFRRYAAPTYTFCER